MPKGVKGFQKGHSTSPETRKKISEALKRRILAECDYCHHNFETTPSAFAKKNRHFCSMGCYSKFRAELLPKEEQFAYGTGYSEEERKKRRKARSELNHFLRDKHIEQKPCEVCGARAEAHHDDYNKPLVVRWLCLKHHREWHKNHENPEFLEEEDAGN